MCAVKKEKETFLSIIEAVETLSSIADMDFEKDASVLQERSTLAPENKISYRTIYALKEHDSEETFTVVKEIFKVVLDYLKNFYRNDYQEISDTYTIEGIKTIMLLVGEAAKKLDSYAADFYQEKAPSITDLKEYRDLQKFYQSRISKKIDQGVLGKWILGLAANVEEIPQKSHKIVHHARTPELKSRHVFVELETVKNDIEYELFYLRKEDGSRFFNPRLIRNMKLVSDFGNYFGKVKEIDPLLELEVWQDHIAQVSSLSLLRLFGSRLDRFFHETARFRKEELTGLLNRALMALILCSHSENLMSNHPIKSSLEYFKDFQNFLWEALHSREYQKLIVYPPRSANKYANCLLDTLHILCRGMFIHLRGYYEMISIVEGFFSEKKSSEEKSDKIIGMGMLWQRLSLEYEMMAKKMKYHPNGSLRKLLTALENGECNSFSPLRQGNLPMALYYLYWNDKKITSIRMPSPTTQEFVNKVAIDELFLGFLRACEKDQVAKKHLLINLQDRTSWVEVGRCQALESLPSVGTFGKHLQVITLACDTDFYHQNLPYQDDNEYGVFKDHFIDHLSDENAGFYFPSSLRAKLFPDYFNRLIDTIHRIFFKEKNRLSREDRLNFISIAYFFLTIKIIEISQPDSFSLACKDGIDVGCSFNMFIISMIKLINNQPFNQAEIECLHYLTYIPSLMNRERLMNVDRLNRILHAIRHIEELRVEFGEEAFVLIIEEAFGPLYETPILHATLAPPKE